jgi:uncharacterized protein YjeT (DUF2065 family)
MGAALLPSARTQSFAVLLSLATALGALAAVGWSACVVRALTDREHPPVTRNVAICSGLALLAFVLGGACAVGARRAWRSWRSPDRASPPGSLRLAGGVLLVAAVGAFALYGVALALVMNLG